MADIGTVFPLICPLKMQQALISFVHAKIYPPHNRWILAQYDVDVFDYKTNRTVEVHPLNEGVDITEVDYSRSEVEVCCVNILFLYVQFILMCIIMCLNVVVMCKA